MTIAELTSHMKRYNREAAPGSECCAWQDYVQDITTIYGISPWDDSADEVDASQQTESYWMEVATGESDDYHPETGARSHYTDDDME